MSFCNRSSFGQEPMGAEGCSTASQDSSQLSHTDSDPLGNLPRGLSQYPQSLQPRAEIFKGALNYRSQKDPRAEASYGNRQRCAPRWQRRDAQLRHHEGAAGPSPHQVHPTPLLSRNHGHKVRLIPPGTKFPLQNLLSKVSRLGGRWDAGSDDPFTKKKAEA